MNIGFLNPQLARGLAAANPVWVSLVLAAIGIHAQRALAAELDVGIQISVGSRTVPAGAPARVQVSFSNVGTSPLELLVDEGGAPMRAHPAIAYEHGDFEAEDQGWIRFSGKGQRVRLDPGGSASGETLVFVSRHPPGLAFQRPGRYRLKLKYVDPQYGLAVESNVVELEARGHGDDVTQSLRTLRDAAHAYYDISREVADTRPADEPGREVDLLAEILMCKGVGNPPDDASDRQRRDALLSELRVFVDRFPESPYAGYAARYLGMVYLKEFEHNVSLSEAKSRQETGLRPTRDPEALRSLSEYRLAVQYLEKASDKELWPRDAATYHLGLAFVMAEQWDDVTRVKSRLRQLGEGSGGPLAADRLEDQEQDYRERLERRRHP